MILEPPSNGCCGNTQRPNGFIDVFPPSFHGLGACVLVRTQPSNAYREQFLGLGTALKHERMGKQFHKIYQAFSLVLPLFLGY